MSQISFADAEYAGKRKKTRREVFLEEMELVVPWKTLLKVIEPFYPTAGRGRRPYSAATCTCASPRLAALAATTASPASSASRRAPKTSGTHWASNPS